MDSKTATKVLRFHMKHRRANVACVIWIQKLAYLGSQNAGPLWMKCPYDKETFADTPKLVSVWTGSKMAVPVYCSQVGSRADMSSVYI